MNFKEILKDAIRTNTKIIITGKSGYGKSEMVQEVAKELNLELVDFRLSEILPEDLVGLPKTKDDFYEYVPPRWLYEIVNHPEKKYLLFLDEITQGTPEVLNICYKIFDKVTKVGNYELPNVYVVGATNYKDESNYINELPIPLKNRACMLELDHNPKIYVDYLIKKYSLSTDHKNILGYIINESNPRSTEKAIQLIQNSACDQLVIPYIGQANYETLSNVLTGNKNYSNMSNFEKAKNDIKNGYITINKSMYRIDEAYDLKLLYDLTDEEYSLIENEFSTYQPKGKLKDHVLEAIYRYNDSVKLEDVMKALTPFDVKYFWYISSYTKKGINKFRELISYSGLSNIGYFQQQPLNKYVMKYATKEFLDEFNI